MVLNGDILEYENIGPVMDVDDMGLNDAVMDVVPIAVEWLIYYLELMVAPPLLRLSGGYMTTRSMTRKRQRIDPYNPRHVYVDAEGNEHPYINIESPYLTRRRRVIRGALGTAAVMGLRYKLRGKVFGTRRMFTNPIFDEPEDDPGDQFFGPVLPDLDQQPAQRSLYLEYPMANRGASMLTWKNKLTRKYTVHCQYTMGPQLLGKAFKNDGTPEWQVWFRHRTSPGSGPSLYSQYFDNVVPVIDDDTNRDTYLMTAVQCDQGMDNPDTNDAFQHGIGLANIVYIFAADWPFLVMNHDPNTQYQNTGALPIINREQNGHFLGWEYAAYDRNNTDQNVPITKDRFMKNQDWTYLTHYYTTYSFDFTNMSKSPYTIEVLFFTFKADPDSMDYRRQSLAPFRRQITTMNEYVNNFDNYPEDINVVYRKRLYIRGYSNWTQIPNGTNVLVNGGVHDNNRRWSYTVKRKYVIKRPILELNIDGQIDTLSEVEFFNQYYETSKGVYCRIQAWPLDPFIAMTSGAPRLIQDENQYQIPNLTISNTGVIGKNTDIDGRNLMAGVHCRMEKKSKIRFDEPMLKGENN